MRHSLRLRRDEGSALRLLLNYRNALICALSLVAPTLVAAQTIAPGERTSINSGWRFQMGDPADGHGAGRVQRW